MNKKTVSILLLIAGLPCVGWAQTVIGTSDFFDPDFRARRPGAGGLTTLVADVNLNPFTVGPQTDGPVTWTHSASGFVQTRTPAVLDLQLAAYTETTGNSLVFGREITSTGLIGGPVATVFNAVAASLGSAWDSTAVVESTSFLAGGEYNISFSVGSGSLVNLGLLSAASFTLTTDDGQTLISDTSSILLNLGIGGGSANFSYTVVVPTETESLEFGFSAASLLGLGALGTADANQNVLTFSGLSVAAVPEPNVLGLLALGAVVALRRKR